MSKEQGIWMKNCKSQLTTRSLPRAKKEKQSSLYFNPQAAYNLHKISHAANTDGLHAY